MGDVERASNESASGKPMVVSPTPENEEKGATMSSMQRELGISLDDLVRA